MMQIKNEDILYDVALSFSGKDRDYVKKVANELVGNGIKVFYDEFEKSSIWGKNLHDYFADIYKKSARYILLFISKNYEKSKWTEIERQFAQSNESLKERILIVKLDNSILNKIKGINPNTAYIENVTPNQVVELFLNKIGKKDKSLFWWGEWKSTILAWSYKSILFIYNVDENGFYFNLDVINGAHLGSIEKGYAEFDLENRNVAIYKDDEKCKINFLLKSDLIQMKENGNCNAHHGLRAHFHGDYKLKRNLIQSLQCYDSTMDDFILSRLYAILTDKYWEDFIKCFSDYHYPDIEGDYILQMTTGVPGMYFQYQAILLISKDKNISGAFFKDTIDEDTIYEEKNMEIEKYIGAKSKLLYFSSNKKVPKAIKEWMKEMCDSYKFEKPQRI